MALSRLGSALATFSRSVKESRDLANDAYAWSIPPATGGAAHFTAARRDLLTEVAFLRAFTSWEIFLEETFLLYLTGYRAPKGRAPRRYGFPPSKDAASEWCKDGKSYAKWDVDEVRKRADRWFQHGRPFTPALVSHTSKLGQLVTVRNAIAHQSQSARTKFENLVRNELQALPPNTTVGSFLITSKPNVTPPLSFMDDYLASIELVAQTIVPK